MTEAEYYQAKSVLDSPNDYDGRMVTDARNYVRGYEDAESQLKAKMPSVEKAGIIAVEISEDLTAQEQAFFIAGFQECIKWLKQQMIKP